MHDSNQAAAKPTSVGMKIHTGMLESLGINMYTSIGKSLVEFVANGFDAEATEVKLTIPFEEIEKARTELREKLKAEGGGSTSADKFLEIYEPLSDDIEIVISDNGHGMSVDEIEEKFLVVNRNRRKSEGTNKSLRGKRVVMGRKGLGKLAGFGVAEEVIVTTKRVGETYSTTIAMDFLEIQKCESVSSVRFDTKYTEGLPADDCGTTIILRRLRCDSLKTKDDKIESILARNFYITGDDFQIYVNDSKVEQPDIAYEFTYPDSSLLNAQGLAQHNVRVYEGFEYPILYCVKFRARPDPTATDGKLRGSLPAAQRGARVYCNQRLAAGPSLFNLETGMHNFHANSYMECVVHADVLDQQESDLIGTNRSGLKTDNEVVDSFIADVTEMMRVAIYEHSKYRDAVVEKEIEKDPVSNTILLGVSQLSAKNRAPAKRLLKTLAVNEGVESQAFKEVAPFFLKAINSSEVLIQLIKTGVSPTDLQTIIGQLTELYSIERSDVLKLYRGRRNAIMGLQILQEGTHKGGRTDDYENELHALLKSNPWLIKPEYNNFLTSDRPLGDVAKKITAALKIDTSADRNAKNFDDRRPDLVFVAVEPSPIVNATVVELKSPNIELDNNHLSQLKGYMNEVKDMLKTDLQRKVRVTGHLIGNLPRPDTQGADRKLLLAEMAEAGASTKWEVISIPQMLDRARVVHQGTIEAVEREEKLASESSDDE